MDSNGLFSSCVPKFLKILKRVSASRAKTEETSNYVKVSMKFGRKDIMRSKMQNLLVQKNAWNVPQNRWKGYLGYLDTFRTFVRDSPEEFSVTWGLIYTLCLYYYIIYAYNWCQLLGNKTVSSVMLQYPRAQILYSQLRLCLFMKKSMGRIHAISFMLPHVQSEASNSEPIRMASCFSHNFRTKNAGKRLMPHCGGDNMDLNFLCELTIMSTAVL